MVAILCTYLPVLYVPCLTLYLSQPWRQTESWGSKPSRLVANMHLYYIICPTQFFSVAALGEDKELGFEPLPDGSYFAPLLHVPSYFFSAAALEASRELGIEPLPGGSYDTRTCIIRSLLTFSLPQPWRRAESRGSNPCRVVATFVLCTCITFSLLEDAR